MFLFAVAISAKCRINWWCCSLSYALHAFIFSRIYDADAWMTLHCYEPEFS